MNLYILGICGTFMGGLALLARELGFHVRGSDANVYPPMSHQLETHGIALNHGYDAAHLHPKPDLVVIGNALSRGNAEVEAILDRSWPYMSGPEWLRHYILKDRWVLGVAGTHGKTTTSSMLAWILETAGLNPGFLIGGVPLNFGRSARLGAPPFFVVEADEYDTSFFDKRSKFVHYHPRTLVLNNLEYDHADIFPDLAAIQRQFHHLVRTVPRTGLIIAPAADRNLMQTIEMGCWTPLDTTHFPDGETEAKWQARLIQPDGGRFEILREGRYLGSVHWQLSGEHNVTNALSAVAAAEHAGVGAEKALESLASFQNVKRRLEICAVVDGMTLYDDFAHHPTAIAATLKGLRKRVASGRLIAVLEPRSNTMRMGTHAATLGAALADADLAFIYQPPDLTWDLSELKIRNERIAVLGSLDSLADAVCAGIRAGDHVVFMSNGSFGGIHGRIAAALSSRKTGAPVSG